MYDLHFILHTVPIAFIKEDRVPPHEYTYMKYRRIWYAAIIKNEKINILSG